MDHHAYSKQHWDTVAQEYLVQEEGDLEKAVARLALSISGFHDQFRNAVVKPDNVLHEFVGLAFDCVDWVCVARSRFNAESRYF